VVLGLDLPQVRNPPPGRSCPPPRRPGRGCPAGRGRPGASASPSRNTCWSCRRTAGRPRGRGPRRPGRRPPSPGTRGWGLINEYQRAAGRPRSRSSTAMTPLWSPTGCTDATGCCADVRPQLIHRSGLLSRPEPGRDRNRHLLNQTTKHLDFIDHANEASHMACCITALR
jgi:hypothetical protein